MLKVIFTFVSALLISSCSAQTQKDTIIELLGTHIKTQFYCNNKLCNGRATSYYQNGKIRLDGRFRKGIPIGIIRDYYEDGGIEDERHYKRGKVMVNYSFSRSGLLTRELNWKKWLQTSYFYDSTNQVVKKSIASLKIYHDGKSASTTYLKKEGKWVKE